MKVSNLRVMFSYNEYPELFSQSTNSSSFYLEYLFDSYDENNKILPFKYYNDSKEISSSNFDLETESNLKISKSTGIDITSELPDLTLKNLKIDKKMAFTIEFNFEGWKNKEIIIEEENENESNTADEESSNKRSISLITIKSQEEKPIFLLSLEEFTTNNGENSGYIFKLNPFSETQIPKFFEIPKSYLTFLSNNSNEPSMAISDNTPENEIIEEIPKNMKITLALEDLDNGSLNVQLFLLNSQSSFNQNVISPEHKVYENITLFEQPVSVCFLSPAKKSSGSISPVKNLGISRIILSDSISNLLSIYQSNSSNNKCRTKCLIPSSNNTCLMCRKDMVYNPRTGNCESFCFFRTKNVNGNCLNCLYADCSDTNESLDIEFKTLKNKKIVTLSDGIFNPNVSQLDNEYIKKHFKLYKVRDGLEDELVEYEAIPIKNNSFEIIPSNLVNSSSSLSEKSLGYRLVTDESSHLISKSKNLYHQRSALMLSNPKSAVLETYNPITNNIKRNDPTGNLIPISRISKNTGEFNKNIMVESVYKTCSFDDEIMRKLALSLFIMICIMNFFYLLYSLFLWNKVLIFKLPSLTTVLCIHINCLYQAMIFCYFYETNLPPAFNAFLRHSYHYAIQWHGAFRKETLKNFSGNQDFNAHYYRKFIMKRLDMLVVQNIFINFGVIFVIWLFVWILSVIFLFIYRKKELLENDNFTQYHNWKYKSFMNRIAISFALKLAFFVWIVFSVEFSFFSTYDLIIPLFQHDFFSASFGFAIFFLLLHLIAIIFLLYLPIYLSEFLGNSQKIPPYDVSFPGTKHNTQFNPYPNKGNPFADNKVVQLGNYLESKISENVNGKNQKTNFHLDPNSIHYYHNCYVTSKNYNKYNYLFSLQGLRSRVGGLFHWGITALVFSLYGSIISATHKHPRVAITINLVLIFLLFVYIVLSKPGFTLLPRIILYISYFIFFVAKLCLLFYVYNVVQKGGGAAVCRLDLAILGLFFAALGLLILGILFSLCLYFNLKNKFGNNFIMKKIIKVVNKPINYLLPDDDKSLVESFPERRFEAPNEMIERFRIGKFILFDLIIR